MNFSEHILSDNYILYQQKRRTRSTLLIAFVAIAKMFSTSTMDFTIMSEIASVERTAVYDSRRSKKFAVYPKRSIRVSWLASTSLAACDRLP
jgi:hypothetical protein